MKKIKKQNLIIFSLIFFFVFIDILTKYIFQNKKYFDYFISIFYAENVGSSFGLFSDIFFYNYLIILVSFIFIFFMIYKFKKIEKYLKNKYYFFSFIFFLSGVLGNLYDRIFFGFVRDFIKIENLFIFNLADFYLSLSLIILLTLEIKSHFRNKKIF